MKAAHKKMIFCSHGRLCEGMLDTLKVFSLADEETMFAIPFYTEGVDSEALLDKVMNSMTSEDQIIIFTDIAYGSVNQQIMLKFSDWHNVTILTGMNLALVLELAATQQDWTAELIEAKIESARSAISACLKLTREMSEEDE